MCAQSQILPVCERPDSLPIMEAPETVVFSYDERGDESVQFRLIYQGPLKATSASERRVKEKHEIRRVLHKQLAILWERHPLLRKMKHYKTMVDIDGKKGEAHFSPNVDVIAQKFCRLGYRFVPLVTDYFALTCSLDVLFLRRDDRDRGDYVSLVRSGGDIDN